MSSVESFKLDQIAGIPRKITDALRRYEALAVQRDFMDELLADSGFRSIAEKLERIMREGQVHAYHCTKQPYSNFFESRGLRVLSMEEHHAEFEELIADKVPSELRVKFRNVLADWRRAPRQGTSREGKLWFCMSRHLVENGCNWRFLKYYGGEAIYWPIIEKVRDCEAFLEGFGDPVVVEIRVSAIEFDVTDDLGFTRDILSHWAAAHNSSFHIESLEACLERDVTPFEIMAVHPANSFSPQCSYVEGA